MHPAVEALVAEANASTAAARQLETEARQQSAKQSQASDTSSDGSDLLAVAADFASRCAALPSLSHAVAQSRLLSSWTSAVAVFLSTAKGPSVRQTLQSDGFEILEDGSKAVGVALDDATAARLRTGNAVESLSRVLAQAAVSQQERTAAGLLAAQIAAAELTSQLSQSTSSLSALRTEMTALQVRHYRRRIDSHDRCLLYPSV